jgi:hypothetical protein
LIQVIDRRRRAATRMATESKSGVGSIIMRHFPTSAHASTA